LKKEPFKNPGQRDLDFTPVPEVLDLMFVTELKDEFKRVRRYGGKPNFDELYEAICFRNKLTSTPEHKSAIGRRLALGLANQKIEGNKTRCSMSKEEITAWIKDYETGSAKFLRR